ncbi:uncharacterized protein BDV17DRAFT_196203 [Aspergillus undulatus]|uniref:uncharacterized protein n=1 Tax=Aspergillus undulatus TaxID=1810928 RepID=UPI003CCD6DEB
MLVFGSGREVVADLLMTLACLPCICARMRYEDVRQMIKRRKNPPNSVPRAECPETTLESNPKPTDIPRRPLTPPLEGDKDANIQIMHLQFQSAFFHKLPPEIRDLIYIYILKFEAPLLLENRGARLASSRADYDDLRAYVPDVLEAELKKAFDSRLQDLQYSISGLLTSCRRIYSESIHIVYEYNILRLRSPSTLDLLPIWIVPPRLTTIRCIHVHIPRYYSRQEHYITTWKQGCAIIAALTNLRRLIVAFASKNRHVDMTPYLEPMISLGDSERLKDIIIYAGKNVCFHGPHERKEEDLVWLSELPFMCIRGKLAYRTALSDRYVGCEVLGINEDGKVIKASS